MESLNQRAFALCTSISEDAPKFGVDLIDLGNRHSLLDFGVHSPGSAEAGVVLALICMANLGRIESTDLEHEGQKISAIRVETDEPLRSCMASQYAGWHISLDKYFAMCSGPIRAVCAREKLFEKYALGESAKSVVGVFETARLPDEAVFQWLRQQLPPSVENIVLCTARTSSLAGRIQIVARSIETACHKLFELGFDLNQIQSGVGIAPIPPPAATDLLAMSSTNDAILFASRVTLRLDVDDATIETIGPQIPSCSSPQFGRSFGELFTECGGDFYRIDPLLFAPAEITLESCRTGVAKTFGRLRTDLFLRAIDA